MVYYYVVASTNSCGVSDYDSMEVATGAGMPSPWLDTDIGNVGVAGGASFPEWRIHRARRGQRHRGYE